MSWVDVLHFSLSGAILMTMALGVMISALIPSLDRWSRRYFITLFSLLFLCAVACFLVLLFYRDPTMAQVQRVIYFFESALLSAPFFMPTVFLLHCSHESPKGSPLFGAVMALLGAYFIMLVLSQFTGVFYYVTADNRFFYGPLYALSLAPMSLILLLNIAGTIRRRKALARPYYVGLLAYLLPMSAAVLVHMFISIEIVIVFGMALFALIMFSLILTDNMRQYLHQQREIANQQASIAVLQMRPHFIYNSLMGIYYLCDQNVEKAKRVTLDFTSYLRKNFAAIASENTVSFTEELEHTRAYLAIEEAQFEDSLFVRFDTPHTAFRLPPLTLQPIVENAVVHGMRATKAPIHISVVTRNTGTASEIVVEDDGPGFHPADSDEPHIALQNIRRRLAMMCGGTLTIASRKEGGTAVTVSIPLPKPEE